MRAVVVVEPERVNPLVQEAREAVALEAWARFVQLTALPIWAVVVVAVDTLVYPTIR
jgi:hypothetical protein